MEFKDDLEALAKKTLEEVPKQFLEYMTKYGIEPLKGRGKITYQEAVAKKIDSIRNSTGSVRERVIPEFL
jgi:hypothetical protein